MNFELDKFEDMKEVRAFIKDCQKEGHIQQVAYSTYHDCLTQVCFTCKKIRTSLEEKNKWNVK